jgi:hypothetical protein
MLKIVVTKSFFNSSTFFARHLSHACLHIERLLVFLRGSLPPGGGLFPNFQASKCGLMRHHLRSSRRLRRSQLGYCALVHLHREVHTSDHHEDDQPYRELFAVFRRQEG